MFGEFRSYFAVGFFAMMLAAVSGCTGPAQEFVNKIRDESNQKCNEGNQSACHTIVQQVSDTRVLIESTDPIAIGTPACMAGRQDACQQMAVLHGELSTWCSMGNEKACSAVNTGPWPTGWDEPALIDAAKLSCLSGQFKPESHTCQALQML